MIKTLTAIFIIFTLYNNVYSAVLWETGFEDVQDWYQARPVKNATGYGWIATWKEYNSGNPTYPPPQKNNGDFLVDTFRAAATLFDPPYVTNLFEVLNGLGRNGSKGLNYNVEVSGNYGTWSGGNPIEIWLGQSGYKDIYVRFYLKYPSEWLWTNDVSGEISVAAQQKLARIARYNGYFGDGGNPQQYSAPYNYPYGKNNPVWLPGFAQNITPTAGTPWQPSYSRFFNSERYAPDYGMNDSSADTFYQRPVYYPQGNDFRWPTDAQWHCYEFRAKMNTAPGVADGISEIWLDGVKVWSKSVIPWVSASLEILPTNGTTITAGSTITDENGHSAKVMVSTHVDSDGKTYIPVTWNNPSEKIISGSTITASNGGTATVIATPVLNGGDVYNGWNHISILDNATIAAHPLASHVTYPLYLDDVVISDQYIGTDYIATCTDTIQNGDETGVDCGGSCPNACSTPGVGVRPWAISGRSIAPGGRPIAK